MFHSALSDSYFDHKQSQKRLHPFIQDNFSRRLLGSSTKKFIYQINKNPHYSFHKESRPGYILPPKHLANFFALNFFACNQILIDFCWLLSNVTQSHHLQQISNIMSSQLDSPVQNHNALTTPKSKESTLSEGDGHFELSGEKDKRIVRKDKSFIAMRREAKIGKSCHVFRLHDILAINEDALGAQEFDQSYFKALFYVNTVDRVQLRKQALIVHLRPFYEPQSNTLSPQSIIQILELSGEKSAQQLAASLTNTFGKLKPASFYSDLKESFDSEPLSRFIDSMEGEIYFCKAEPNKLVISRTLLQLLGEDPENYALEMVKYRMPLREIISARSYPAVLNKIVENLGTMCDFISGDIKANQLHACSSLDFDDYLLTRQHTRIPCSFHLYMPTPQMTCFMVREVLGQQEEIQSACTSMAALNQEQNRFCQQLRYSQAEALSRVKRVPQGLLRSGIPKQAGYKSFP